MVTSSNLIAQETIIIGNILTQGNIRIEGRVDGALESKNKIVIGDSAQVFGDMYAMEAEVSGHIDGSIHCQGTLYLKKTAFINGDIVASKLIIENGALFNGKCQMSQQTKPDVTINNNNGTSEKKLVNK